MKPIILASASASRAAILRAANVIFEVAAPEMDEQAAKPQLLARGDGPRGVARGLADMKALAVSSYRPGLVIGADQTLDLDGALVDKPSTLIEARERLVSLRGRTHRLHAAVAVAVDGQVAWRELVTATLTMRMVSDDFLDGYLRRQGEAVLSSSGAYMLEGEGVQLFDRIEGDYFSILGLPLIGLLGFLRHVGALAT